MQMGKTKEKTTDVALFDRPADYRCFITNNYDKFHTLEGNRDVKSITAVKRSIQKYGYLRVPILVNEHFEVIEGQHRLQACRELGVPVHYIIQPGLSLVHCTALNVGRKTWTSNDYLHAGSIDNMNYAYFEILAQKYPQFTAPLILCTYDQSLTGGSFSGALKSGTLKCTEQDFNYADRVLTWLSGFGEDMKSLEPQTKSVANTIYFALVYAYRSTLTKKKELTDRLHRNFGMFDNTSVGLEKTVQKVEKIYNYKVSDENKVDLYSPFRKALIESKRRFRKE